MGMKSKVASMQRGAQKREDSPRITNAELYDISPPLLTDAEIAHFQFGNRTINDFFLGLADILKACHHSHMPAGEVAKVLNARKATTACGAAWTPRLAWFLMKTWRIVHFAKHEKVREATRRADEKIRDDMATAINRAVARQNTHTFQKVLRNYFKNPTLGEIFPELGALKRALLAESPEPVLSPDLKPVAKPAFENRKNKARPVAQEREANLQKSVQFSGTWENFFSGRKGRNFLVALVRTHPKLLELAPAKDVRFLGHLRARKAEHPEGKYWMEGDAEQVRLAILTGIHKEIKGK